MKISELINELQKIQKQYGDLQCYISYQGLLDKPFPEVAVITENGNNYCSMIHAMINKINGTYFAKL